jgi:hypothetical protein
MYVHKRVICEWCRSNYKNLSYSEQKLKKIFFYDSLSIHGRSNLSHAECVMCMQRNGYSFTVFLGEPDFYWFDWFKTATDFESLVPRRRGMDFYRASNSSSWGAAVEGAICHVCRGWERGAGPIDIGGHQMESNRLILPSSVFFSYQKNP